ncbi:hypothetical protein GCM10027347_44290 [Larkinella harenae]
MATMQLDRELKVGDLIEINHPSFNYKRGVVCELYQDYEQRDKFGVSLVLEDFTFTGDWTFAEQCRWMRYIRPTGLTYHYKNELELRSDIRRGVFNTCFKDPEFEKKKPFVEFIENVLFPIGILLFLLFTLIAFC